MKAIYNNKVVSITRFEGKFTYILNEQNEIQKVKTDRITLLDDRISGPGIILWMSLAVLVIGLAVYAFLRVKYGV